MRLAALYDVQESVTLWTSFQDQLDPEHCDVMLGGVMSREGCDVTRGVVTERCQ